MVDLESALVDELDPLARSENRPLYLSQFSIAERSTVGMTPALYTIFLRFIGEGNGVAHPGSISLRECNEVMAGPAGLPRGITELIALLTKHQIVRT